MSKIKWLKWSMVILLLGIMVTGYGLSSAESSWTQQLGTSSSDHADGVATDASGNIYVAGTTDGGLDGNTSAGLDDLFVVKYDSFGVKQWTRQLGTPSKDVASDVATDASGNIYVAGATDGGLDGNTSAGSSDLFVVKYDSFGVKQWASQLGTSTSDLAYGVATDASGNVYVAGTTDGGLDGNISAGSSDFFLVKYNSAGEKQWTRQSGTPSHDRAYGVATDASGNIYVVGATEGELDGNTNAGLNDLFVVKYDSFGAKQWTRELGTSSNDGASDVATDASGNIYVTGLTYGGLDGNAYADEGDFFVVKYNPAGVKQWTRELGTPTSDIAYGVATDALGNIYVAGTTYGGLDGNPNAGEEDLFVVKYDPAGVWKWTRQSGTSSNDVAYGVATDASGNIYVAGYTYGDLDGDGPCTNAGWDDIFVFRYESELPQPPNAPSNLVATAVSSSQIDLTWQDNAANEQGSKIERKTTWYGNYEEVTTVSANVTSYSDINLLYATQYYYRVRAYNQAGGSEYSNDDGAKTFAPTIGEIITVLNNFYQGGLIYNFGVYNSLSAKIIVAQNSLAKGNLTSAINQLNAFCNEVLVQTGQQIEHQAGNVLYDMADKTKEGLETAKAKEEANKKIDEEAAKRKKEIDNRKDLTDEQKKALKDKIDEIAQSGKDAKDNPKYDISIEGINVILTWTLDRMLQVVNGTDTCPPGYPCSRIGVKGIDEGPDPNKVLEIRKTSLLVSITIRIDASGPPGSVIYGKAQAYGTGDLPTAPLPGKPKETPLLDANPSSNVIDGSQILNVAPAEPCDFLYVKVKIYTLKGWWPFRKEVLLCEKKLLIHFSE